MVATAFALALAACGESNTRSTRHLAPIPPRTLALMAEKGMSSSDPILVRAYKTESELELWKRRAGQIRAPQDLPDLPLVGPAWAEDQGGRPPGA
jgi:murein L,D-transpeptidase YafK